MFARRLARSVGRLDWWNVYDEHTDYQWACQVAAEQVDPTGDARADLRAAHCTANLMAMQASEPIQPEEFSEMCQALAAYLAVAADYEDADDLRAVRLIRKKDD